MDLTKSCENPYEEQVRLNRLRNKQRLDELVPPSIRVPSQIKPAKKPRSYDPAVARPSAPQRRSARLQRTRSMSPPVSSVEQSAAASEQQPVSPTSKLVDVLRAGDDSWLDEDHVRDVAGKLSAQRISAKQIITGAITEAELTAMGLVVGDVKRIVAAGYVAIEMQPLLCPVSFLYHSS